MRGKKAPKECTQAGHDPVEIQGQEAKGCANAGQVPTQALPMVEMDLDDGEVFGDADDDSRQCLEDVAQPGGVTLVPPEEMWAPKEFEADLEKLRHWRAGDQEIDLLAEIRNDEIAKAAEDRTGRSAEEILSNCTLVIGDVQFLDSWIVLWPSRFIRAEDQFPVRLLLQFAWWYSTPPNQDRETDRSDGSQTSNAAGDSRHTQPKSRVVRLWGCAGLDGLFRRGRCGWECWSSWRWWSRDDRSRRRWRERSKFWCWQQG